jgi:hypothetical protein
MSLKGSANIGLASFSPKFGQKKIKFIGFPIPNSSPGVIKRIRHHFISSISFQVFAILAILITLCTRNQRMMLLDFEKPIAELESKLQDMKHLASGSDKEVQAAVKALEKKILDLKKETFENLTGWQRVQLSRHPDRPYTLDYIYEITTDFIEIR